MMVRSDQGGARVPVCHCFALRSLTVGSPLKLLYAPTLRLHSGGLLVLQESVCSVVSQDPNHKSTSARSEAAASAARAAEATAARAAEATAARAAETSAARCPFLPSACEWASTRARPAACALKCALARAVRRALAVARRCRLGLDVARGLGVGGGDVLRGGEQARQPVQLVSVGAPACTAATVTTCNSNATRGRRSGARRKSGLRRFASAPPWAPVPSPSPSPTIIYLPLELQGTSRKRCVRALTFLARYLPDSS